MDKLSFDRSAPEGLVLRSQDGAQYMLDVTPELRTAVRGFAPPPEPEPLPDELPEVLRPKDIQALVRAGTDLEALAAESGRELNYIERWAAPVLDERRDVAERARAITLNHGAGAPSLEQAAAERLAGVNADPELVTWDAVMTDAGWVVKLSFVSSDSPRQARWSVDLNGDSVHPINETAEWIGQDDPPDTPVPAPTRHLSAVRDAEVAEELNDPAPLRLLDELMDSRGLRPVETPPATERRPDPAPAPVFELHSRPVSLPTYPTYRLDEEAADQDQVATERVSLRDRAGFHEPTLADASADTAAGGIPTTSLGAGGQDSARQADSQSKAADAGNGPDDGGNPPEDEPPTPPSPLGSRQRPRAKRSSVPSWDEIVFGASRD